MTEMGTVALGIGLILIGGLFGIVNAINGVRDAIQSLNIPGREK